MIYEGMGDLLYPSDLWSWKKPFFHLWCVSCFISLMHRLYQLFPVFSPILLMAQTKTNASSLLSLETSGWSKQQFPISPIPFPTPAAGQLSAEAGAGVKQCGTGLFGEANVRSWTTSVPHFNFRGPTSNMPLQLEPSWTWWRSKKRGLEAVDPNLY